MTKKVYVHANKVVHLGKVQEKSNQILKLLSNSLTRTYYLNVENNKIIMYTESENYFNSYKTSFFFVQNQYKIAVDFSVIIRIVYTWSSWLGGAEINKRSWTFGSEIFLGRPPC